MAKATGAAGWIFDAKDKKQATDKPQLTKQEIQQRDQALQVAIGEQLLAVARYAGERSAAGDVVSINLLYHYLMDILGESTRHLGITIDELETKDMLQ